MSAPYTTPSIPALASQRAESPQGLSTHRIRTTRRGCVYSLPSQCLKCNGRVVNGPCTRGAQSTSYQARTPGLRAAHAVIHGRMRGEDSCIPRVPEAEISTNTKEGADQTRDDDRRRTKWMRASESERDKYDKGSRQENKTSNQRD